MNTDQLRTYRFETKAQWNTCLFSEADRSTLSGSDAIRPFAPFGRSPMRYETRGARLPVITRTGEIIWVDNGGTLHRLTACNDAPESSTSPGAVIGAFRIMATSEGLWILDRDRNSLELYETDSFTRLVTIDLSNLRIVDIASDGRKLIYALVQAERGWKVLSFNGAGHLTGSIKLQGHSHDAVGFGFLRDAQRFVVLTGDPHPKLIWFSIDRRWARKTDCYEEAVAVRFFSRPVSGMRPCFEAMVIGSDARERVFLAGRDGKEFGRGEYIVTFDSDGNSLGDVPVDPRDAPITGLTGYRDNLLATGRRGMLRFTSSRIVPDGAGPVRSMLITPMLSAPDSADKRRWLRVEATAQLPEGSTLEISYVSADKEEEKNYILTLLNDKALPASRRVKRLRGESDLWKGKTVFQGSGTPTLEPKTFSVKLFDEQDRYVWVGISLTAANGSSLPELSRLEVLYPGRTLMENLPAIYQIEETRPNSFLRSLVGVLETTTHGIDNKVASMGSLINPSTAPGPWLDFIARWVGVPWDDALKIEQKRRLLGRAAEILKGRGTRRGLEALLDALMPGPDLRFRVTDTTADFGFAIVGGESCIGTTLPAMLGTTSLWNSELDWYAVLGRTRLPCTATPDDGVGQLAGKIRIEVAATAKEREAWEPWLPALIAEMVPITTRVELRWVTGRSFRGDRLDDALILEPAPTPHLGTDAITDLARLPEREVRLSDADPIIGRQLR